MAEYIQMEAAGQSAPGRVQPETNFTDGSGAIFSFFLERAEKDDDKMTESWKGDADGILVFTGLFSATVATFLGISLQSLTQSSQDTSAFYLVRLYQLQVADNGSASVPLPPLPDPSSFSPSASAIWVNVLWFLSLIISLTCALLATLLQQWARRYLRLTRPAHVLHKRARVRNYLREGVDKFYLPSVVEALPGLLHASVFLFFAGLSVFLVGINNVVFKATLSCISASAGLYLFASLIPLICHDSPFHTPLSTMLWFCDVGVQRAVFSILTCFYKLPPPPRSWTSAGLLDIWDNRLMGKGGFMAFFTRWRRRLNHRSYGMINEVKRAALQQPQEIDARAIQSFILTLDEDHEIERLVAGIPGFYSSEAIINPSEVLMRQGVSATELSDMIIGFMERSLSSDVIPEDVAVRRSALCVKAFEAGSFVPSRIVPFYHFLDSSISYHKWINYGVLANLLSDNNKDKNVAAMAQHITAIFTASIGRSDERWFPAMMRQFRVTEDTLQQYIAHGNSLSVANLLYFVSCSLFVSPRYIDRQDLRRVKGDKHILMEDTLPELQRQFCEVWNAVVDLAKRQFGDSSESDDQSRRSSLEALEFMHNLFISLHPELVFPFQLRRSGRWREVDLPDTLPALPSCPNPECHTVRMQLPGAHDPQSYPSPENPPSSLGPNTTITPSDEGFTNAHAAPVSQPVAPSFPSPSPPCEPSAILSISPNVSRGSGAPMVDASPPSHVSDDTSEPSRSSSPIASFTVQRGETSTTSLLHGAQDAAGWSGP